MNDDTPNFLKIGNIYLVFSGWALIGIANITPFVYGTFFNYQGIISYIIGISFLYWNYRFVKSTLQKNTTVK